MAEKIPAELSAALARDAALQQAFAAMSPSHRREYTQWVADAKRPATRTARAEKALAMIAERARA
jgi:uncharacterized protein YdeI (YjbR/CyaY-like superfamily)